VKKYGIYLAYPPTVDMRDQGLGRHLAMLLKGAEPLADVRFTIVCPSWSRDMLQDLFESEQVSAEQFEIVAPKGKPYALRCFEMWRVLRTKAGRKTGIGKRAIKAVKASAARLWQRLIARAVSIYGPVSLLAFLGEAFCVFSLLLVFGLLASPVVLIALVVRLLSVGARGLIRPIIRRRASLLVRFSKMLSTPQGDGWVLRLYEEMQKAEMRRMHQSIDGLSDIKAWYCPTAFWPSFNDIKAPRLMCVPDVVLADFPGGFASVGGDRYLQTFETIKRAIRGAEHFVTYSDAVKWETLVDRNAVVASNVSVIHHASNDLSQRVDVIGFPDAEATSRHYCKTLLRAALQRSTNAQYTSMFHNGDVRFLFYASQLRPNKNVITLLRAYKYLLRERYIGHKLILTGRPSDMHEIGRFVADHRLERDVLFLPGLSVSELAACYKLADLAVNPSLSEGGCPFTFAEALSLGTPVVMARIPVTEEVLSDSELQEVTFFDPYNWRDCAGRIEWAISNREKLLSTQLDFYESLSKRTWTDVANEYVSVLDKISKSEQDCAQ
jgi:glycosyltransferase involved in cell wall biosynthesis